MTGGGPVKLQPAKAKQGVGPPPVKVSVQDMITEIRAKFNVTDEEALYIRQVTEEKVADPVSAPPSKRIAKIDSIWKARILACDHRQRFAKVDLRVSWIVVQWHEHLAQPLAVLVHVAPYDRHPTVVSMLSAQPLENPFRRVLLLGRLGLILLQDPVDDPDKRVQLRSLRRPAPSITRRHRERQHLRHRPWVDPKAPCCFPLTDSLYVNRSSYLRV